MDRTETLVLASNPQMFVHLSGPDPRTNPSSVLVVLVHGFPELGYSWRYQWSALARLGYSVCSPDMRGYGQSWVPPRVEDYTFEQVTLDLQHLVHALNRKQAVFVGHDFGGSVVWSMGLHRPETCLGVVGVNTPLMLHQGGDQGPMATLAQLASQDAGHTDYQVYFQRPLVGERELNADPERTMRAYFRSQVSGDREADRLNMRLGMRTNKCRDAGVLSACPKDIPLDPLWSPVELSKYVESFAKTGFPLNWYRAWDLNWEWDQQLPVGVQIPVPCMMVSAEYDAVLSPQLALGMQQYFALELERKQVQCGHWTMIERKHELNAILADFLTRRFPTPAAVAKL